MKKLISYEYRNNKKEFNKLMLILMAASTLIQVNIFAFIFGYGGKVLENIAYGREPMYLLPIFALITIFTAIAMVVVTVIYYIKLANILKKDIYDNQSYIVFSLPVSGKQIIGSKLIIGLFYSFVMPIVLLIFNIALFALLLFILKNVQSETWNAISSAYFGLISLDIIDNFFYYIDIRTILINIFEALSSSIFSISVIFAAVVTDWSISKHKKNTSMWILYTILFMFIWGLFENLLGTAGIISNEDIMSFDKYYIESSIYISGIIQSVIKLAASIGLYFYTSHIFSNKIEI